MKIRPEKNSGLHGVRIKGIKGKNKGNKGLE